MLGVAGFSLLTIVRGYRDPHRVFAFHMFNESSVWQADIVRVTIDGRRVSIDDPWPGGYRWATLVPERGLAYPQVRRHADAGVDSTLAFLDAALDWVALNTPADPETRYLEATVTYDRNTHGDRTVVLRSVGRAAAGGGADAETS